MICGDVSCQSAFFGAIPPFRCVFLAFRRLFNTWRCAVFFKNALNVCRSNAPAGGLRALPVFVFRRRVRFDVLRAVCTLFVVCASVFQKMRPNRHLLGVSLFFAAAPVSTPSGRFVLFLLFSPLFFSNKCTRTGVCGGVLARFYIVCVFALRRCAVSTYSDRFCREALHRVGLYRMGLCRVDSAELALPDRLCRVGFAGSACAVRPTRTRARGGRSHGSLREVYLTVKHINALNRCIME